MKVQLVSTWLVSALVMGLAAFGIAWLMRPAPPPALATWPGYSLEAKARNAQTFRKLQQVTLAVHFAGDPLDEVIDRIRTGSGANIFVDWVSLEFDGIDRRFPVALDLRDVTWSAVLTRVLQIAHTHTAFASYTISDGIVVVAGGDTIVRESAVTRAYDVRDLIESDIAWRKRLVGPNASGASADALAAAIYEESVESITKIITEVVATETWKENGGMIGSLKELNGRLVVTQSTEAHAALEQLLGELHQPSGALRFGPSTQPATEGTMPPPGEKVRPPGVTAPDRQ